MIVLMLSLAAALAQDPPAPDPERVRLEREIAELDRMIGPKGETTEALPFLKRGKACFRLGRWLQDKGKDGSELFERALEDFQAVHGPVPGNESVDVWIAYSFLCLAESRGGGVRCHSLYDNAKGHFDLAWMQDKKRPEIFVGRGQAYLGMGGRVCLEAALDNFNVAVDLDPRRAAIRRLRAKALQGLGRAEDAEKDLRKAGELSPARKAPAVTPELEREIADLVPKMGADEWEVREKATQRLVAIGEPAVPSLEAAARSDDPEVKSRATAALEAIAALREGEGFYIPVR